MVLKGVSQKVIEVVHTDNRYFEKAILFLRPSAQGEDRSRLRLCAGEYLSQINLNTQPMPQKKGILYDLIKIGVAAVAGAALACAFFLF